MGLNPDLVTFALARVKRAFIMQAPSAPPQTAMPPAPPAGAAPQPVPAAPSQQTSMAPPPAPAPPMAQPPAPTAQQMAAQTFTSKVQSQGQGQ